jgi:hypothetical protein
MFFNLLSSFQNRGKKYFTFLFSTIFVLQFSLFTVSMGQAPVAYYPFNGNANDESGNGNNGTVNGNATFVSNTTHINLPFVHSVSPFPNQLSIPKSTNIFAAFNTAMDIGTFNASTILVSRTQSGKHNGSITLEGDTAFTFDPDFDFRAGEIVYVTLTNNMFSIGGDTLKNGYHWSFTVQNSASIGTLTAKTDYTAGTNPQSVYAADVDFDGDIDLVTANSGENSISVLKNNGNGTFAAKINYATQLQPKSIFISEQFTKRRVFLSA